MTVAYFMLLFPAGLYPIINGGALVILCCFIFLYFAANGAGSLSLEAKPA